MTTTLQIVADDLTTVLFDFDDPTGANNPDGVRTQLPLEGSFALGVGEADPVVLSPSSVDGGFVVSNRTGLGSATWRQFIRAPITATTPDELIAAVGELGRLLSLGGVIKYIPHASTQTRYIDFEPSPTPALYEGQPYELTVLTEVFAKNEGILLQVLRQPYLRGPELLPAVNLATNPTLTHDFGGTANRPDGWTWDVTTGITDETIAQVSFGVRRGVYRYTIADAGVHQLQQNTAVGTFAPGDVATFSFWARVTAAAPSSRMQAVVLFQQADTTPVGGVHSGSLVTLTTAWQRLSVTTTAAGALTSRVLFWPLQDNTDAASMTPELCNAQLEKAAAPTPFRVPATTVAYNPTSTTLPGRKMAVWGEGNAPSLAKFKVTADALTLGRYRVFRVSDKAVDILKATLHKELRLGALGADTTSVADSDGADGNVAQIVYTEPDPAFGTDSESPGTVGSTITLTKPTSLVLGECMVVGILRHQGTTQILAPIGWELIGFKEQVTSGQVLYVWLKIADAFDVLASTTDYTFQVLYPSGGTSSYRGWIARFTNIDPVNPVDDFEFATEDSTTTPTLPSLSTSGDDAMIVAILAGQSADGATSFAFGPPSGSTPTYTERADHQTDVIFRAIGSYTGVLATEGATGTKDASTNVSGHTVMCHLALRKAPAVLAKRTSVAFTALPPGEYEVWLSMRPTAACRDRIRIGWALKASPTDGEFTYLPDYVLDVTGAATFTEYVDRMMGRIFVPEDHPLDTVTVAVFTGREQTSSANLRLDIVALGPAFEHVATVISPTLVGTGEFLASDGQAAFHLDTAGELNQVATVEGPPPLEIVPGYQVLYGFGVKEPLAGFADPVREITAAPTIDVTTPPRYRT